MVLDALFGEPRWLWDRVPHPAIVMGRIIGWGDKAFNNGNQQRLKGAVFVAALVIGAVGLGAVLTALPGLIAEVCVASILLAQRSLIDHVRAVANALRLSLGDGRLAVSNIVGRDTDQMTSHSVARSAIESAAENFSDGVVAPAFWFLVAGLPGILVYKAVNTADSMIGYRTPRHGAFGWAAARLDDLLNLAPARLTAVLIWALSHPRAPWTKIAEDARLHRSPNAGWPEAAMARAVDVALSGPRSYDGQMRDYPFVNASADTTCDADDIDAACDVLWQAWTVSLVAVVLVALF